MATPPHETARDDLGPRRLDPGSGPVYHARPLRALPRPRGFRFGRYLANAVAIVIAVVLAPALTTSQATVGVPRESASTSATVTQTAAVAVPTASTVPTQDERFGRPAIQGVPDRSGQRQSVDDDHDDTVAAPAPGKPAPPNGSRFVAPVPGPITGAFGQRFHPILRYWRMHNGVDMTAGCGTVVVAAYGGRITFAGVNGGYGNLVVVDHGRYKGKHVTSKYAHLSRIGVRVGDKVRRGQGIALSGTTGLSTGCHLHFEIQENGGYVDPAPYLTGKRSPRPDVPIRNLGPRPSPTPTRSASPSPSPTRSASPLPSPSRSVTPSATPSPSSSVTPSPTPSRSATPTPTTSATPTRSATPTPSPSQSERTPDPNPSPTERTPEPKPSETERSTPTPSAKEEETPSPSAEPSP